MQHFLSSVSSNSGANEPINYNSSVYLGDLLVTCYSLYSRNRTFGNMIGKGYSVEATKLSMQMVAEGIPSSRAIHELSKEFKISMPIAESIYSILWEGKDSHAEFKQIEKNLF